MTLDDLSKEIIEPNLLSRLIAVEERIRQLENRDSHASELSEISGDMGSFWGGDIFALEDGIYPDDPSATGVFMTLEGYTIDGVTYKFGSVKNGHIVFGITIDGLPVTGGGAGSFPVDEGLVLDGVLTILSQLATYGAETRRMRLRMNLPNECDIPEGNEVPAGTWDYASPSTNELLVNGSFDVDTSNWTNLTSKSGGYSGKYAEVFGVLATAISSGGEIYAAKINPVNGKLYVTGNFTSINSVAAARVAVYDFPTTTWSAMGTGLSSNYGADLDFDSSGNVIVVGAFGSAGGASDTRYIGQWNIGTNTWSGFATTGLTGGNVCFGVWVDSNDDIWVAGDFSGAGGVANTNNGAMWDSSAGAFVSIGVGGASGNSGLTRCVFGDNAGKVYYGGSFTSFMGTNANNIIVYDTGTTTWSPLGGGGIVPDGLFGEPYVGEYADVYKLALDTSGDLYAIGVFTSAPNLDECYGIARWDGADWYAVGSGTSINWSATGYQHPLNLHFDSSGNLYLVGWFDTWDGTQVNHIVKWNGFAWSGVGDGCDDWIMGLDIDSSDRLYLAGDFQLAEGVTAYVTMKNYEAYSDIFDLTAGDNSPYTFDGYFRNLFGRNIKISIRWYDSGSVYISETVLYQGNAEVSWTNMHATPTPPDGTAKADIYLITTGDYILNQVDFDSMSFTESTSVLYGIMLHPYPLSIISDEIQRLISYNIYGLPKPTIPVIALLPTTWQPAEANAVDTFLYDYNPTTNYDTSTTFHVGELQGYTRIGRALFKFAGLDTIPDAEECSVCKFYLTPITNYVAPGTSPLFEFFLLLREWIENQATWNIWKTSNNWTTAGAGSIGNDRSGTLLGSKTLSDSEAINTPIEFDLDPDLINSLINGTNPNYGWLAKTNVELNDCYSVAGSSHATATYRPKLALTMVNRCTNGAHLVKIAYEDQYGIGLLSDASSSVTVDDNNQIISITNLPIGPWGTLKRHIYMTKAGGTDYYYVKTINDNITTSSYIAIGDASLTVLAPTCDESGNRPMVRAEWDIPGYDFRTTVTMTYSSNQWMKYTSAGNANDGDEYWATFIAEDGTYNLILVASDNTYMGKADIYIDNELVWSGVDTYAGAGALDVYNTTNVVITGSGVHLVKIKMNGKNGSSSDYGFAPYSLSGYKQGVP